LLDRVAGNRIDRPAGSVIYTQLLERNGGIAADVTVTRLAEEHFRVVTGAGYVNSDLGWLRLQVHDDDAPVEIRETTDELSVIGMWGPNARDVLERVADGDVSESAFPFMQARHIRIGGATAFAQRVTYVGELGWELYLEPGWAVQVWDRLISAGRTFGIVAGGYRALDSLRMEKGFRYYGTDLTLLDNPFEAGLGFCVQLDKGEFNGRQALLAARDSGLKRRLRTLAVGGEEYLPIYGGEAVHGEGGVIGRLRSCAYGFTARKNLSYSYLPVAMLPGEQVQVEVFGELIPATVTADAVVPKRAAEQPAR
ncbi:MAG TPA: aminomethyltransferase family protein, partial [Candidatus Dormibacteraeota bacterium]